jgi:hypothetical protein
VNGLTNVTQPVEIILDLGGGTYSTGGVAANPPANVTFVVQNGTLDPSNPALTVAGGQVSVQHCTLTTSGDAPTLLVTGGSVTLLNDTIDQTSTVFTDPAIALTGGTVNLGNPGNNTISVNNKGDLVSNTTGNAISAVGDTFIVGGTVETAPSLSYTSLSSTAATSVFGQAVTLTATVVPNVAGSATPTGSVDFYDATTSTDLGSVSLVKGVATLSTAALAVGTHALQARYGGDSTYLPSLGPLTQTVNAAATITAGSVFGSQYFGQSQSFTATVTAKSPSTATPTGSVDFFDTTTNVDLGKVALANGKATLSTSALPLGTQTITLSFQGNTSFLSGSTTVSVTIVSSVFVLNGTASGALTLSGSSSISESGTVTVDSSSKTALSASGSAKVTAGSILVVGGYSKTGSATLSPTPTTGIAPAADPLAGLPAPSTSGLTNYGAVSYSSGSHTLNPGIYTSITASKSATLTLNAGVYILEGAGLTISGSAVVSGTGVMLYNTSSTYPTSGGSYGSITLSNSGTLNLTAATTGTYAGVSIFQDRGNIQTMTLSGSAFVEGTGNIVYVPDALVSLSNSANLQGALVVGTLSLSGSSDPGSGSAAPRSGPAPLTGAFDLGTGWNGSRAQAPHTPSNAATLSLPAGRLDAGPGSLAQLFLAEAAPTGSSQRPEPAWLGLTGASLDAPPEAVDYVFANVAS